MIFGYIVVFGSIFFSAILLNDYQGKDFAYGYKQTPNTSITELITELLIPQYNPEVIVDFPRYSEVHMAGLNQRINNLFQIWSKMEQDKLIDSLIENSIEDVFNSKGEFIQENIGTLSRNLAEQLVQYQYKIPVELPIDLDEAEGM